MTPKELNPNELSKNRTELSITRSHLSNERTHLSYLRTGISLISFGITINRFSWFLMENKSLYKGGHPFLRDTKNAGIGMVIIGCAMLIWSTVRYNKTAKAIETLEYHRSHGSIIGFTLAVILLGVLSTIWLILE